MKEKIKTVFSEFYMIHKVLKKRLTQKINDTDLSLDQCCLLFLLNCDANINQKTLAQLLHISEATLSVRISRLDKSGYIIKEIDKEDKRNSSLEISQKGKDILKTGYLVLNSLMESIFEGISEEEVDTMLVLLNKIKNNIERGEQYASNKKSM